ncbi:hypothetical protein VUR80DRAFT_7001 [Thermomyces stellatus]
MFASSPSTLPTLPAILFLLVCSCCLSPSFPLTAACAPAECALKSLCAASNISFSELHWPSAFLFLSATSSGALSKALSSAASSPASFSACAFCVSCCRIFCLYRSSVPPAELIEWSVLSLSLRSALTLTFHSFRSVFSRERSCASLASEAAIEVRSVVVGEWGLRCPFGSPFALAAESERARSRVVVMVVVKSTASVRLSTNWHTYLLVGRSP